MGRPNRKRSMRKLRKRRYHLAKEEKPLLEKVAMCRDLTIRTSCIGNTNHEFHWMFECPDGKRVLDWWPGNGTWRDAAGNNGKIFDPWGALDLATERYMHS